MLLLLLETGRPIADIANTKVTDLDWEKGVLHFGGCESVPLSKEVMSELKRHLKAHPGKVYLFEGRCGKPITSKWIRCVLEPAARKASVEDIYAKAWPHK